MAHATRHTTGTLRSQFQGGTKPRNFFFHNRDEAEDQHDSLAIKQSPPRYPRSLEEINILKRQSFFFATQDNCQPTPILGTRTRKLIWENQGPVGGIVGSAEDFRQFTGEYDRVVYFEDIKLEENAIGDVGICHLVDFLVISNILVRNLRIYKNNIGELGARALAAYVSKAPVHEFHASHNYINKIGGIALVTACISNPSYPIIYPDYDKWYGLWAAGNAGRGIVLWFVGGRQCR